MHAWHVCDFAKQLFGGLWVYNIYPSAPHRLQAFCSSITGTLATLAILKGVGVGDSSATPLAATVTWMLKGSVEDEACKMFVCEAVSRSSLPH